MSNLIGAEGDVGQGPNPDGRALEKAQKAAPENSNLMNKLKLINKEFHLDLAGRGETTPGSTIPQQKEKKTGCC